MKKKIFLVFIITISVSAYAQWQYPPTRTVDSTDTYWGKAYKDSYRWLENVKSTEVADWFKAQANLSDSLLNRIPERDSLAQEWMALDKLKPASYSNIAYENGRVFYKKTLGGENVGKLFYRQGWNGEERLLFDPSGYKTGVTTVIQYMVPSFDGRHVALGISSEGAEVSEIRVINVDRGTLLPESIYPSQTGPIGWTLDHSSFFYIAHKTADTKSPEFELNVKTRIHKLGTDPDTDIDFFSNESYPDLGIASEDWPFVFIDESYPSLLLAYLFTVQSEIRMYVAPVSEMKHSKMRWNVLCQTSDSLVRGIEFHENSVYAITHKNAPKYKLIRTNVDTPDWKNAETVVPETSDVIETIVKSKDYLFIIYSNGIVNRVVKYAFATGRTVPVALPISGTVYFICPDKSANRCIVSVDSWTLPTTVYDYDADKDVFTKSMFNSEVSYPGFENLVAEEVEVPGHDGVMIPLSIIHEKELPLNGNNCCILDGYGAYGISNNPGFSIRRSLALKGVVLAYAHVRGGSEKGEQWYKAGYKTTKPNTWKDFISCAEYLIQMGYTSSQKLAGTGTSAGGILISRAVTERPDLFRAAICNVGCANAMRMEFTPNGPPNVPEFGTVKDSVECAALYEMDGVAHVRKGVGYPAVICVAGWNDPRVTAWEPGKFAAALQNATSSGRPVLMKVNYNSGHFTEEKIVTFKNFADQAAFVLWQTGHPDFQPKP
jgi:prolyl oligopeptidase